MTAIDLMKELRRDTPNDDPLVGRIVAQAVQEGATADNDYGWKRVNQAAIQGQAHVLQHMIELTDFEQKKTK